MKKENSKDSKEKKSAATKWDKTVGEFAIAIGMNLEEVNKNEKLQEIVGEPGDEALGYLLSEEYCPKADLMKIFAGVPKAKLSKAIDDILRVEEKPEVKVEEKSSSTGVSLDILPKEMSEDHLLEFLKTGGVLKVNEATVIMALRAAIVDRTGVFEIRKTLTDKMKKHAESLGDSVDENFFKIHNELTRRKYGEIFSAVPGAGNFVSAKSISDFLGKLNSNLWPSLYAFQELLTGWVQTWQQGVANPTAMMAAMTAMMSGNAGGGIPGGMMAPPPTDGLRDAAESFNEVVNKVFSGTGTIVASALGYDAKALMNVLNNPQLPAQIGAANKDQMLKMLNINVSADVSRLATNTARYALSIMEFPNVGAGNEEMTYLTALIQLGGAIPWDQLKGTGGSGITSKIL